MNIYLSIPEKNPFVKKHFQNETRLINEELAMVNSHLTAAAKIRWSVVEKIIQHLYSLVPDTEEYQQHNAFLNGLHVSHKGTEQESAKKTLELMVYDSVATDGSHGYSGFWKNSSGKRRMFMPCVPQTSEGMKSSCSMLEQINSFFKGVGGFAYKPDFNYKNVEVWFELFWS